MKRTHRWILGASLFALTTAPASADTLREALLKAYQTNPTITGARADLRATDENVPIARASGLPSADVTGAYNENVVSAQDSYLAPARVLTARPQLSVPIYQGGAVKNSVRAAETRVLAGRASLRGTEANLFTRVVAAYMDVIRDQAIVQLNQQNVHVLDVNLQATQDRFQVGDLTRTDVAQSEARLAQARGQLRNAQAQLISSRETYVQVVGDAPQDLQPPPPLPTLPNSPQQAVSVALNENPSLEAAKQARRASAFDVSTARAGTKPKLNVVVGANYNNYLGSLGSIPGAGTVADQTSTSATAGLQLSLPLFQGGRPAAQVRKAQAQESSAIERVTEVQRGVIADTRSAYASWKAAQDLIDSSQVAVRANRLSLEGVRAENSVGTRTILDILNAEQELLNSQVNLVTAQRNAYVAGFALLAAMGKAEAQDLQLDSSSLYDPTINYQRVRGKIWDWDSDPTPKPVATDTDQTAPQTSDVNGQLQGDLAIDPATMPGQTTNPPNGQ
ncbi:TolC family outer membrane protein [Stakelama marina]|uniref:TolC family outer membrane protein n=1 Tax=Stakelama marina TaxID=2826939 RepID=A0A8T4IBU1_9SPHN|nr:TolC family outer membrane protein [Stakelama marina]MBR0551841.1 TolC family outer membrane protein [Stakelama marina]